LWSPNHARDPACVRTGPNRPKGQTRVSLRRPKTAEMRIGRKLGVELIGTVFLLAIAAALPVPAMAATAPAPRAQAAVLSSEQLGATTQLADIISAGARQSGHRQGRSRRRAPLRQDGRQRLVNGVLSSAPRKLTVPLILPAVLLVLPLFVIPFVGRRRY
jgi:hypothetical protein